MSTCGLIAASMLACTGDSSQFDASATGFQRVVLVPVSDNALPWGKEAADINADGRIDVVVAYRNTRKLVGYIGPDWTETIIATGRRFGTGVEVFDMDADGIPDIIASAEDGLFWLKGPHWLANEISDYNAHNIVIADFDGDGTADIAARNQSAFGGTGNLVRIFLQTNDLSWDDTVIDIPKGEGLSVADIDRDGRSDIVVNGVWLHNAEPDSWETYRFAADWNWPHAIVAVDDLNGDDCADILLTPSEPAGERYRISWFENPCIDAAAEWPEHVIEEEIESVVHSADIGDIDLDGSADILIAEMHQGNDPDLVKVYLNGGSGLAWRSVEVDGMGSHGAILVDLDHDGDLDILGANWSGDRQDIMAWQNLRRAIDTRASNCQEISIRYPDVSEDDLSRVADGDHWPSQRLPGERCGATETALSVEVDIRDHPHMGSIVTSHLNNAKD